MRKVHIEEEKSDETLKNVEYGNGWKACNINRQFRMCVCVMGMMQERLISGVIQNTFSSHANRNCFNLSALLCYREENVWPNQNRKCSSFIFKTHLLGIPSKCSRQHWKVGHNKKLIFLCVSFFSPIVGFY